MRKQTPIGTRVLLTQDVDHFPLVIVKAGATGTLVRVDDVSMNASYWVKLDQHVAALDEWDNELEIPDYSIGSEGDHPETFIRKMD